MKYFILFIVLFFFVNSAFSQTDYTRHTVKSKQTLYSISREYGVTVDDLLKANEGLDAKIHEGQVILVPKIVAENDFIIFHVTSKTNLRKVAGLYNIPTSMLEAQNPDLDYRLFPGQKVKIPVGKKAIRSSEIIVVTEEVVPELEKKDENIFVKSWCNTENPNTRKTFKVALMIPFYLEQADSIQIEQFLKTENEDFLPFRFIGFYEGALMAVDSLRKQGMNISLYVYDVDDDASKTSRLLQNQELRKMDLIIGPFLNKSFAQVAIFAGNYNIPIVNPLSFRDEVTTKYKTVIKVKPKNSYQNKIVTDLIRRDFPDARVYLIKQSAYQDAGEVQELQQMLQKSIPQIYKISNRDIYNRAVQISKKKKINYLPTLKLEGVNINAALYENRLADSTVFENQLITINYSADSLQLFMKTAPHLRNSLVIIYGDNKAFVMDLMNKLNEVRDTFNIRIIGMPGWERFSNLDNNQCNDMNLIYLSSTFTDFSLPKVERFNYYFREQYATEPSEYAFSGFDITYYFLYTLFHFDNHLNECLEHLEMNIFQSTYQFNRVGNSDNFENTYWNILEYNQFKLEKISDPPSSY